MPWSRRPPARTPTPRAGLLPANESVTPQSSKVCVVTVSIIYLFTRLQFSACLSNSIIDRELAASRRSAGLRANSLRRGGRMPGPGEVELTPCGSVCWRQERGLGGRGPGTGLLQGAPGTREMLKAACPASPRGSRDAGDAESCLPSLAKAALDPPPLWEDQPQRSWAPLGTSGSQLTWTTSVWPRWFCCWFWGLPCSSDSKESACNAGDEGHVGLIPGLGRSPGEGHGNPLQYSCLENPRDRGAWWVDYSPRGHKEWDMTEQLTV